MKRNRGSVRSAFTLIELMITVAIIGILAATAIPAFMGYTRRAKASEATGNLKAIFTGAASYYLAERSSAGIGASSAGHCTVSATGLLPAAPGGVKQQANFSAVPSFSEIGFSVADFIYYGYAIDSAGASCGGVADRNNVYTFYAEGDLDADGTRSRFELASGTDPENQLYHAPGFYVLNETE
jgi:prepilin-type N-terminal cleavage/methylation domain-containing protein